MSKFDILICGAGGAGIHCGKVARTDGRGRVVALFEPVASQLEKAQAEFPDALVGDDYEKLLDQAKPDAVIVAGPDHLHADQTIAALNHGCHVLVEKPLATTVADAQRVLEAEKRTGLHVMSDHTMRYVHPWKEMVQAAKAGGVGEIFFVQGDYIHDMTDYYLAQGKYSTPWRVDQQNPQNILLGGGIHPIDLMLWAVDSPVDEVYMYSNKKCVPEFPSDDGYILIMRFANNVMGKCFVTSGCSGPRWGEEWERMFEGFGTNGTLSRGRLHRRDKEPVEMEDTSSANLIGGHGWGGSVPDFLSLLEGKIENPITARAGARNVSICVAGMESVRTGRPQRPEWF